MGTKNVDETRPICDGYPTIRIQHSPGAPVGVADEVAAAEAMGYARVGIWDSPALFREPWVTLAAVAQHTHHIALGTWVTNPLSRHPVVTASAAATLDDLAPGRVYLGIGTGDTGALHLGLQPARLAQLEDYVLAVRRLLEDGRAHYQGQPVRLEWARRRIPIVIAAHGARSLRLAGRIGDGVVVGLGITPEVVQGALEILEQGAAEAGRRLADIDVWFTSFWFVDAEPGAARQQGAWAAIPFVAHFARAGVEGKLGAAGGPRRPGRIWFGLRQGDPRRGPRRAKGSLRSLGRQAGGTRLFPAPLHVRRHAGGSRGASAFGHAPRAQPNSTARSTRRCLSTRSGSHAGPSW